MQNLYQVTILPVKILDTPVHTSSSSEPFYISQETFSVSTVMPSLRILSINEVFLDKTHN